VEKRVDHETVTIRLLDAKSGTPWRKQKKLVEEYVMKMTVKKEVVVDFRAQDLESHVAGFQACKEKEAQHARDLEFRRAKF
jgi:hypothetical protein